MAGILGSKPKDLENGLSLFCPEEILSQIDFAKEARTLNNSSRISRKVKTETLKINFIMTLNYLSHKINTNDKCISYVDSRKMKAICSDKYYRVCIDILKRLGILYVKTYKEKEYYQTGLISKGYRWNKSNRQLKNMTDVSEIRVTDHRTLKKIMSNIDVLQCFLYSKPFLNRLNRKISKYKRPKNFGKKRGLLRFTHDVRYIMNWWQETVFVHDKKMKVIDNRKKYGLQRRLYHTYGVVLRCKYYKQLTFEKFHKIITEIEKHVQIFTEDLNNNTDFREFFHKKHKVHQLFVDCNDERRMFYV